MDEIVQRLNRINAAVGGVDLKDFSRLQPVAYDTASGVRIMGYDFSDGKSEAELLNDIFSLVHMVAHLRDHLKRWAKHHGRNPVTVEEAFKQSRDLRIIQDLSNIEKHGPSRDKGHSGMRLSLGNPRRTMVLKGGEFCARLDGSQAVGNGGASIQTNALVVDESGQRIGDIHTITMNAVQAWELLLKNLGVNLDHPQAESDAGRAQGHE